MLNQKEADIIKMFGLAKKLSGIVKAAKLIYAEQWQQKKKETLEVIDAYMIGSKKETRLASAIEMASIMNDQKTTILLLAAAADD